MAGIFITGATSGLGWALAVESVQKGVPVGLVGRRKDRLDSLSSLLEKNGATIFGAAGDVTNESQMAKIAEEYLSLYGAPDLLFANAGVRGKTLEEQETDDREIMETNYFGAINSIVPFLPDMIRRGHGHILVISSLASKISLPGAGGYCASKAAIDRWAGSKRTELTPFGVYVTVISPGYILTEMTKDNPYPMPFIISPTRAAKIIFKKIYQKNGTRKEIRFPFALSSAITLLTMLPSSLQEKMFNVFKRKHDRLKNHQGSL